MAKKLFRLPKNRIANVSTIPRNETFSDKKHFIYFEGEKIGSKLQMIVKDNGDKKRAFIYFEEGKIGSERIAIVKDNSGKALVLGNKKRNRDLILDRNRDEVGIRTESGEFVKLGKLYPLVFDPKITTFGQAQKANYALRARSLAARKRYQVLKQLDKLEQERTKLEQERTETAEAFFDIT